MVSDARDGKSRAVSLELYELARRPTVMGMSEVQKAGLLPVGLLFAAGVGFAGYALGALAFVPSYAIARLLGYGAALESRATIQAFAAVGMTAGLIIGAIIFVHWHRSAQRESFALSWPRLLTILTLAPIGAVSIAHVGWAHNMLLGDGFALLGISFVGGALVSASVYRSISDLQTRSINFVAAFMMPLLPLLSGFVASTMPQRYEGFTRNRIVWINVIFPQDAANFADPPAATASLRTATKTTPCSIHVLREDTGGHPTLYVGCEFSEWIVERSVVLEFPDRRAVTIRLPSSRKPDPMAQKSAPQDAGNGITYRHQFQYWL